MKLCGIKQQNDEGSQAIGLITWLYTWRTMIMTYLILQSCEGNHSHSFINILWFIRFSDNSTSAICCITFENKILYLGAIRLFKLLNLVFGKKRFLFRYVCATPLQPSLHFLLLWLISYLQVVQVSDFDDEPSTIYESPSKDLLLEF